jgi:hypothetical protein
MGKKSKTAYTGSDIYDLAPWNEFIEDFELVPFVEQGRLVQLICGIRKEVIVRRVVTG